MSATWYDVLGVDPTATADEIRAAWKQAISDLEPTDRRFRACNQAAEVLLDPQRRAAYDAELTPAADEPVVGDEQAAYAATAPAVEEPQPSGSAPEGGPSSVWTVPARALAVLAALTATLAVLAAIVQFAVDPPASSAEDSISEARDAATESMPVLFSYDYRTAEADRDQALRRTTGCFHDQLQEVWDEALLPSIRQAKGVAKSSVKASGVVRASGGGDRVELLVVLDTRTSTKAVSNREVLNFTVTMVDEDGEWLVEDVEGDSPFGGDAETESEECADD